MYWWEQIFGSEYVYSLLEGGPSEELAQRQADFVSGIVGVTKGVRILDVGCGRGWLSIALAKKGAWVTGQMP